MARKSRGARKLASAPLTPYVTQPVPAEGWIAWMTTLPALERGRAIDATAPKPRFVPRAARLTKEPA